MPPEEKSNPAAQQGGKLSTAEAMSVMLDGFMFRRVKEAVADPEKPLTAAEMTVILKRLQRDGIAPARSSGSTLDEIEQNMIDAGIIDEDGQPVGADPDNGVAGRIPPAVGEHEPKPPRDTPRSTN